ncbi:NAD-glutamate dehydrogenase domain-containing protein [Motiliproteus sp. SC1-56]|uniref:NAD-glutamate dehydrogenase domain-containing protein n=1 Tax=Motiliproteus sp. SC1-56 TaxID=2799565 RepID=UPI001A8FF35B|nr:NAD-glutamate dehydrogenase domain-containing protein [Motiliproteus sp. SC1-56]
MSTKSESCAVEPHHSSLTDGAFDAASADGERIELRVIGVGPLMPLSRLLPKVENLGVEVVTSASRSQADGWQIDLSLRPAVAELLSSVPMQARFVDTLLAVADGRADNDGFNRLVTLGDFGLRKCVLLRGLARYLSLINLPFSRDHMAATLCQHPEAATALVDYFRARFDPDQALDAAEGVRCREQAVALAESVASLDEERILTAYIEVIDAIVRTNFFVDSLWKEAGRCLVFKLTPGLIHNLPQPAPAFEIFVYGTAVEGVHLRGGKVARGGLRWSERQEDYRTEVLGLVKAQMVKNAVIVPTGAKGGFICKRLNGEGDPRQRAEQVRQAYCSYINALLEVTDNRFGGVVVPPSQVVRYDDDDPYLVVAADKGTATFSDTANGIAQQAGFWLGDAFASGGSKGYDHKKMGITARGAWESTKRLFRELGVDTQTTPFQVVGIGDMGGDVFGNGMLLSRQIKLVAAFNHEHIFLDPTPDPASSFAERQRLFATPGGARWSDYDPTLISPGGGVHARTSKRIPVSPQVRRALAIEEGVEQLSPDALIRAILSAKVDLLWNGGIGTYVRASHESDAQVGDRSNDPLRISAPELRVRVVVEGGNLGLTQAARIEFARSGGRITTDAVDNSAGVDCSDHEVNIKILLDALVIDGALDGEGRDRLLEEMTDEVARLVLDNNYQQSKMLSQSNYTAPAFIAKHAHLIQLLEREGRLDRRLEALPDDVEIEERIGNGEGLSRPEIAVLLAYAKSRLFEKLAATDLIDDPFIVQALYDYFPAAIRERFPEAILAHPLCREILAAQLTNQVMNRMGSTFAIRLLEEQDVSCARWIQSYAVAREALGVGDLVKAIEGEGFNLDNATQMELQLQIHHPLERATHWVLEQADWTRDTPTLVEHYRRAVQCTRDCLGEVATTLQAQVEQLEWLYYAFDIAQVAERIGAPLETVAKRFFAVNKELDLFWLRQEVERLPAFDKWHRKAKQALIRDIDSAVKRHLEYRLGAGEGDGAVAGAAKALRERINEVRLQPSRHLAMLIALCNSLQQLGEVPDSRG